MSDWTLNGAAVLSAQLHVPRVGNWIADLVLDLPEGTPAPAGAVQLTAYGETWQGYVLRAGTFAGATSAVVVGGRGLWKLLAPRSWRNVPLRQPLQAILADGGEALSADSDPAVLAQPLGAWVQLRGTVERCLSTLLQGRAAWRVKSDGTIWVGKESWPAAPLPPSAEVIEERPADGVLVLAAESTAFYPGTTWTDGRRISDVEHSLAGDAHRVTLVFEEGELTDDRLREGLAGFVRDTMGGVDYLARYTGKVVLQHQDGRVDVEPEDERLAGLPPLEVRFLPGCRVDLAQGARVLIAFDAGDPALPFAEPWGPGASVKLQLSAQQIIVQGTSIEFSAPTIQIGSEASLINLGVGAATIPPAKLPVAAVGDICAAPGAPLVQLPGPPRRIFTRAGG